VRIGGDLVPDMVAIKSEQCLTRPGQPYADCFKHARRVAVIRQQALRETIAFTHDATFIKWLADRWNAHGTLADMVDETLTRDGSGVWPSSSYGLRGQAAAAAGQYLAAKKPPQ